MPATSRASVIGRTVVTGVTKHLPCGPGTGPHLLHRLRNPFLELEPGKVKAKAPWKILVLLPPHPNHGCTPGPGRSGCALTPANPGPSEQSRGLAGMPCLHTSNRRQRQDGLRWFFFQSTAKITFSFKAFLSDEANERQELRDLL